MKLLTTSFLMSFLATLLLVKYKNLHNPLSSDNLPGPQKFHIKPVPRVGSIGIFLGLTFTGATLLNRINQTELFALLICSLPAFGVGLLEDLTKKVGVKIRLIGILVASTLVIIYLKLSITNVGISFLNTYFMFSSVAFIFACISIAGLTNAYNIIDGLNGLASVTAIITLLAITFISHIVGDNFITSTALILTGSIAGVLVWNYPKGLIFIGDGGAYLIGFIIAVLSIMLIKRNPDISPWFAVLINIYPTVETLFTIWRRFITKGKNPGSPDRIHLHSLIFKRVVNRLPQENTTKNSAILKNSQASPYLWLLSILAVLPACFWWKSTPILQILFLLFSVTYFWIYRSIVKFKTPRWFCRTL